LKESIETAKRILKQRNGYGDLSNSTLDETQVKKDQPLFDKAREILGEWVNSCAPIWV
jgi:hypothetical protein